MARTPRRVKRLCIVGNGPSAAQYAREIDTCDFVVRLNMWAMDGSMGTKWSAWCSSFSPRGHVQPEALRQGFFAKAPKDLQIWLIGNAVDPRLGPTWGYVHYVPGKKTVRFAPPGVPPRVFPCYQIASAITTPLRQHLDSLLPARRNSPSTGLIAIGAALRLQPEELVLVGFDATVPSAPGWGDSWNPVFGPAAALGHNFPLEKQVLDTWAATGKLFGSPCATRLLWWRMKAPRAPIEVRARKLTPDDTWTYLWLRDEWVKKSDHECAVVEARLDEAWTVIGAFFASPQGETRIVMAPERRRKHLAAVAIQAGTAEIKRRMPRVHLVALVPPEDTAALRAYERGGYAIQGPERHGGRSYLRYEIDTRHLSKKAQESVKTARGFRLLERRASDGSQIVFEGHPDSVAVMVGNPQREVKFQRGRHLCTNRREAEDMIRHPAYGRYFWLAKEGT